uniref:Uncharacterized protein n=1 Tax=Clandestinovirus TaxID=2831644 RepID=A0A8F8KQW4_9VIRU|nr:hypothetical protein KOM_12_245 [Clandestinovirus]
MAANYDTIQCTTLQTSTGSATSNYYKPVMVFGVATSAVTASTGGVNGTAYTFTIPVGTLASIGHSLEIMVTGTTANNANAKSVGVQWGSGTAYTSALKTSTNAPFDMRFTILRTSSSTVGTFTGHLAHNTGGLSSNTFGAHFVSASNFDQDQTLSIIYNSSAASDIVLRNARVFVYS